MMGQSRMYRVPHLLRTDGVHCLKPVGARPVVVKVVPVMGAVYSGNAMKPLFYAPPFSKPAIISHCIQ